MANLPQRLTLTQTQQQWAAILNPVIANPMNSATILKNQSLVSGANTINTKLGQPLQGWNIVRWHGAWAQIYDTQDTNPTPSLTLTLTSSAPVLVDILVF